MMIIINSRLRRISKPPMTANKKIYANFSNKDLKYIESIDLRINNQAIIKYKAIE